MSGKILAIIIIFIKLCYSLWDARIKVTILKHYFLAKYYKTLKKKFKINKYNKSSQHFY